MNAGYLVPHHTRPLIGESIIYETLTNSLDAIQFVHDQTICLMNQGLTPPEIVEQVKLPPHLAGQPYLQEYYGTVPWSVRAIFDGYLGWFGGNATDLFPLSPDEKAKRFINLAGSEQKLLEHAKQAVSDKETLHRLTLQGIFDGMAVKLNPHKSAEKNILAGFRFPDAGEAYTVHVRHGVAEIQPEFPDNPDISLTVDSITFSQSLLNNRYPFRRFLTA